MPEKAPEQPAERVTPEHIEAKLRGIKADIEGQAAQAKIKAIPFAVGAGVVLLFLMYLIGKRVGKKKSTVVEIRRI